MIAFVKIILLINLIYLTFNPPNAKTRHEDIRKSLIYVPKSTWELESEVQPWNEKIEMNTITSIKILR